MNGLGEVRDRLTKPNVAAISCAPRAAVCFPCHARSHSAAQPHHAGHERTGQAATHLVRSHRRKTYSRSVGRGGGTPCLPRSGNVGPDSSLQRPPVTHWTDTSCRLPTTRIVPTPPPPTVLRPPHASGPFRLPTARPDGFPVSKGYLPAGMNNRTAAVQAGERGRRGPKPVRVRAGHPYAIAAIAAGKASVGDANVFPDGCGNI